MKNKLLILILSWVIISCNDDTKCPAFDFNSSQMDWFLFPENVESSSFVSKDGSTENFIRNSYEFSNEYSIEGGLTLGQPDWGTGDNKSCESYLTAIYSSPNLGIEIENNVVIGQGYEFSNTIIKKNRRNILLAESENFEIESWVNLVNSLEINGETYNDVISFELERELGTIWVSKKIGIVGIAIEGDTLTRK